MRKFFILSSYSKRLIAIGTEPTGTDTPFGYVRPVVSRERKDRPKSNNNNYGGEE